MCLDWVNEVWLCGFSEPPGIPLSFEEDLDDVIFFEEALLETINVFEMWARQDELDERGLWCSIALYQNCIALLSLLIVLCCFLTFSCLLSGLWTILMENNLPQKNIVAFLFALMDHGLKVCLFVCTCVTFVIIFQVYFVDFDTNAC